MFDSKSENRDRVRVGKLGWLRAEHNEKSFEQTVCEGEGAGRRKVSRVRVD